MAERKPFAVQAAQFSVFSVPIALVLGFLTLQVDPLTRRGIGFLNLGILVAGLLLGIVALLGIRRHGTRSILWRAIIGVILNAGILSVMTLPLLFRPTPLLPARIAGAWTHHFPVAGGNVAETLTLNADGTYRDTMQRDDGRLVDESGNWTIDQNHLMLETKRVDSGDPSIIGQRISIGLIRLPSDGEMILVTSKDESHFRRK